MKLTSGIFFTWEEVNEAIQTVLDDKTVDVRYEDGTYGAYSEDSDTSLDMGQVDGRLAQYAGLKYGLTEECQDRFVGYASVFGLVLIEKKEGDGVWLPAEANSGCSYEEAEQEPQEKKWCRAPAKPAEVAVVVEGGLVQGVYASDEKTCVSVLDMDTSDLEVYEELEKEQEELQTRIDAGELHQIY